ncbi:MAG: hypothetical protein HY934_08070 [Candidatus Firestonebacteria bacterium]|nr:hypothetical protein [Candidatus Firestonebacteria bacterium]
MAEIQQDEIDLKQYYQILKKHKGFIISVILLFFICSSVINIFILPKIYSASGKIFINRNKMQLKMEPRFQTHSDEDISYETYVELLKNREILNNIINRLKLNMNTGRLADMILINNIHDSGKSDVLQVIVEAGDPLLAKNIVNILLEEYIIFFQKLYASNPRETKGYINQQVENSKHQLEKEEDKLKKFNEENSLDLIKKQIEVRLEGVSRLEKELASTQIEKEELEYKLDQLKKEVESKKYYLSSPLVESNSLYQELQRRLINLEIKLAEIKQSLSEKHPTYQETLVTIEQNRVKIQEVIQSIIENYNFKLSNFMDREKTLKEDINKYKKEVLQFQAKYAELDLTTKRLQRNQELATQTYTMLANKIEELKIEDKVQPTLMKIIEYAEIPESPTKPRIIRNIGLISILGFFMGIFLAFIKEYFEN